MAMIAERRKSVAPRGVWKSFCIATPACILRRPRGADAT